MTLLMLVLTQASVVSLPIEYDSFVKLERGSKIYNGINIAEGFILTEAKEDATQYSATFYGENGNKITMTANVVKQDLDLGLSLLRYEKPAFILPRVRICRISKQKPYACVVRGWGGTDTIMNYSGVIVDKELDIFWYLRSDFHGFAMLNDKNELIGFTTSKSAYKVYWVDGKEIYDFVFGEDDGR